LDDNLHLVELPVLAGQEEADRQVHADDRRRFHERAGAVAAAAAVHARAALRPEGAALAGHAVGAGAAQRRLSRRLQPLSLSALRAARAARGREAGAGRRRGLARAPRTAPAADVSGLADLRLVCLAPDTVVPPASGSAARTFGLAAAVRPHLRAVTLRCFSSAPAP